MDSVTEEQIKGVADLLQAVLAPNNENRRQSEVEIAKLRQDHPNELTVCLLHILQQHPDASVKTLAAVILRQMFSNLSPKDSQAWARLTPNTQALAQTKLLDVTKTEPTYALKKKYAEVIAELAVKILAADDPGDWSQLTPFVMESIASADPLQAATGFHILSGLVTFFHEQLLTQKDLLKQAFTHSLGQPSIELRVSCIDAICSLLGIIDLQDTPFFSDLLPPLLKCILSLVTENPTQAEQALKHLRTFVESEPKFFIEVIGIVAEFVTFICGQQIENLYIKYLALDIMVTLAERLDEHFRNNPGLTNSIVELIFKMMISVEYEVDDSWATPPEGYTDEQGEEDSLDIDYALLGRKLLGRMLEDVSDSMIMPNLLKIVQESLGPAIADWRIRYAAIMTIAELAQYIQDNQKVAEIVPILQAHLDPALHAKLRTAVFLCIAKLSEDYEEEFQANHKAAVMPMIMSGLDDPIQRVVASAAYALNKFMETAGRTIASEFSAAALPKLIGRLGTGNCSYTLEQVLDAMTSLAETSKQDFVLFYEQSMQALYTLVNNYTGDVYKRVRGKAIECLTHLCNAVGKEAFSRYSNDVIQLLRSIQQQTSQEDSLQAYLLAAWQRLSATLGADFAHYLPEIIPHLLYVLSGSVEVSISTEPGTSLNLESLMQDKPRVSVNTADIETKEVALHTLLTIVDILKGAYSPYVQESLRVVTPLVGYTINETVRGTAATLCASLVVSIKESNHPNAGHDSAVASRTLLQVVWTAAQAEFDTETLVSQLNAIKVLIETPGIEFLTSEEVNRTGESMMTILDASLKRRQRNDEIHRHVSADDSDDEDELINELNKKDEDTLHTAVSEVLGALFKTHRFLSLHIVEFLYNNVLSKFIQPESTTNDQKFAIFVIDDIIEFVGHDLVGSKWSSLAEALVKFVTSEDDAIRQAAAYGIGMLASCSNPEVYGPWSAAILEGLHRAMEIPAKKSKKNYNYARDNIIAAVGKIIKHQSGNIDVNTIVPSWLKFLPVRVDKEEGRQMHDLLADLCLSHFDLVAGATRENLGNIIMLFGELLETKLLSKDTVPKIRQFILGVQAANYPELGDIWSRLSELQQKKLTSILN